MKNFLTLSKILLAVFVILLYGCEDDHYARYEDPPWLGGSIIETLEKEGDYTILLELMKKAGYEEPITKGLYTIMAANDSAYQAYFQSAGIASVDAISDEEAMQLFTLNIMNTPKARQQFIYDYSYWHGGWQEKGSEIGALLWRMPTQSKNDDYDDFVRYYEDKKGETLRIQGQVKWVPYFSTEYFEECFGDPTGTDYNFFFPNTTWSGLQWYNANVLSSEAKCSNGYIYYIDKAVPAIPSMEEYLKNNQDKFGVFYDLIQRFAYYSFVDYDDDADQTSLYTKGYSGITNIANEATSGGIIQRKSSWSALIPTDDVLQEYINATFMKHFSSLDEVPEIALTFLAQSCFVNNFCIPSKMQKQFFNYYGDVVPINIYEDISDATMLSNGPVYTMNKYYPPRAFTSTIAPVFFDSIYTTLLYGINASKMIVSLTSPDLNVTIFASTNDGFFDGGIRYNDYGEEIEYLAEDGLWSPMNSEDIKSYVSDQITLDAGVDYSKEGFVLLNSGNYVYYNNNKLQAGGNQELGNQATIKASQKGDNGILYFLDEAILGPKNDIIKYIAQDEDLTEFYNLLFQAGLADTTVDAETDLEYPEMSFIALESSWTVFAPTNKAIIAARDKGIIPEDEDELKQFLRYHFVFDNVIFNDGKLNGSFSTAKIDSSTVSTTYYAPIEVINSKHNLSLVDHAGNKVDVNNSSANNLVKLGVLHKIDKVLLEK